MLNDSKRPSGLPLLERPAPESYWTSPRWRAVGSEVHVPDLIRFVDERVPDDARIALAITASDPGYVLLGPRLRRFDLLSAQASDAPGASWLFVSPLSRAGGAPRLCGAWERVRRRPTAGPRTGACAPAADAHRASRAGDGDRTRITSLEGWALPLSYTRVAKG